MSDPKTTDPVNDLRYQYCRLMREIKMRLSAIRVTLEGKNPLPSFIAFEHCYLQLRMICECIALGCLAVHGDIPATQSKRLKREYAADEILKALERLHPRFFQFRPLSARLTRKSAYSPRSLQIRQSSFRSQS